MTSAVTPTTTSERVALLDSLRGFAVLGIFLANMLHFTGYFFLTDGRKAKLAFSGADHAIEFLLRLFVEGKFYSLFSLLFGIGFYVLLTRCEESGRSINRFFSRRLFILLMIGLVHACFIWFGDILTLYALVGFALLLFRRKDDRTLLWWSVVLFCLPVIQYAVVMLMAGEQRVTAAAAQSQAAFFEQVMNTMVNGSFGQMFQMNIGALIFGRYPDLIFTGRAFKVLATFLIGFYVGRNAILARPDQHLQLLKRVAVWGFAIGLPANMALAFLMEGDAYRRLAPLGLVESLVYGFGVPSLAFAYAATFALLWQRRQSLLTILVPAGRMALSNYLLQSIIGNLIFKGYGLGLMGQASVTVGTLLAILVFIIQIIVSSLWLRHFRFGPAEWLWRSLTYGKAQPMRAAATSVV